MSVELTHHGRGGTACLLFCLWLSLLSVSTVHAAGLTSEAEAAVEDDSAPDPDETGWLHASAGISMIDSVEVDQQFIRPGFDPVPTFSVGWAWRISSYDLGLGVEHVPGAKSKTWAGEPLSLGDQIAVTATIRYRFVDEPWGGFYAQVNPGLGVFVTTETLRWELVDQETAPELMDPLAEAEEVQGLLNPWDVATLGLGFTLGTGTGLFVRLDEGLQFIVEIGAVSTIGRLGIAGDTAWYHRYRGRVRAGLEWRL